MSVNVLMLPAAEAFETPIIVDGALLRISAARKRVDDFYIVAHVNEEFDVVFDRCPCWIERDGIRRLTTRIRMKRPLS